MHFKTSHVIVYQLPDLCLYLSDRISKHLMLLFIDGIDPEQIQKDHFKTSHVIVYPGILGNMQNESYDFKTSHVIVYLPLNDFSVLQSVYFKTSHVIVYRDLEEESSAVNLYFKTSHVIVYLCFLVLQFLLSSTFQNISCYCLSAIASQRKLLHLDFKTSHVIVYRRSPTQRIRSRTISKHLMLLFIHSSRSFMRLFSTFQNISCYCLSKLLLFRISALIRFQNISCYCLSMVICCM